MSQSNDVRCLHALFCESARIELDGTTTLVSLFTRVTTRRLPLSRPLCYACFLELDLTRADGPGRDSVEVGLRIHSPFGVVLHDSSRRARFLPHTFDTMRCCLTIPLDAISFEDFGEYAFELYVDDEFLHRETLTLKVNGRR